MLTRSWTQSPQLGFHYVVPAWGSATGFMVAVVGDHVAYRKELWAVIRPDGTIQGNARARNRERYPGRNSALGSPLPDAAREPDQRDRRQVCRDFRHISGQTHRMPGRNDGRRPCRRRPATPTASRGLSSLSRLRSPLGECEDGFEQRGVRCRLIEDGPAPLLRREVDLDWNDLTTCGRP